MNFTFIEFVIMPPVISILVDMFLPVLLKCKGYVYKVLCATNLRQLDFICIGYADDYKFWIIPYNDIATNSGDTCFKWVRLQLNISPDGGDAFIPRDIRTIDILNQRKGKKK